MAKKFRIEKNEELEIKGIFSTRSKFQQNKDLKNIIQQTPINVGSMKVKVNTLFGEMNVIPEFVINKAIIPDYLKVKLPVPMFHAYDYPSFAIANKIMDFYNNEAQYNWAVVPDSLVWCFKGAFINGLGGDMTMYVPTTTNLDMNTFRAFLDKNTKKGDLCLVWVCWDDAVAIKSFFAVVVLSAESFSYDSFVQETRFSPFHVESIKYFSDNELNYYNTIHMVTSYFTGTYKDNQINALSFKTEDYSPLLNFINIPLKTTIHRHFGLYTQIDFDTNELVFEYKYKY